MPQLFANFFADPIAGFAFAAIAIGAMVPASVMVIAASNLFTRNFYQEFIRQDISTNEEATVSRIGSAIVLVGALIWVLSSPSYAITLQLAGGVWVLQTLPAVFLALYIRWLDRWALVAGWLVGMVWGTYGMIQGGFANGGLAPPEPLGFSTPLYVGFYALAAKLLVVFAGSALARVLGARQSYGPLAGEDHEEPERA